MVSISESDFVDKLFFRTNPDTFLVLYYFLITKYLHTKLKTYIHVSSMCINIINIMAIYAYISKTVIFYTEQYNQA